MKNAMKILKPSLLILSLLCVGTLAAQYYDHRDRQVDSLERVLATDPPTGKDLRDIYRDLMWGLQETEVEKSMHYARLFIEESIPIGGWRNVCDGYWILGLGYYSLSDYGNAKISFDTALEYVERMREYPEKYTEDNIDDDMSAIYGSIASLYNTQGLYHEAIEYYTASLAILEKHDWKESQSIVYENIGGMYLAMDNYGQAQSNYSRADSLARLAGDSLRMASVNKSFADLYTATGEYDKALRSAESAYGYFFSHPEEGEEKAVTLNLLAHIHLDGYDDAAQSETYARQGLALAEELGMPREVAAAKAIIAEIHLSRGEWRAAERTALDALSADDIEPANTLSLYGILAQVYARLGDADRSVFYFNRHDSLQSTWATRHYQSAIREMETRYETEKIQTRVATLEDEKRLITWLGVAAGAVLLLALAALFFIWRWTAQRKRLAEQQIVQLEQEKQLVATQALLDGEVQERARLARDLHDGLGSLLSATRLNFEGIQKDVTLDAESKKRFETAIGTLDESMHEMRRVAHHLMPDALVRFGLKTALSDFCTTIPSAEFVYYGYEQRFDRKLEVVIYRIAHELINNALRHAGAERILVQIVQEADRVALTVQDDGRGFDPATETQGMGLQSIRARVASFGGTMDLRSSVENGTEINVEFQINS